MRHEADGIYGHGPYHTIGARARDVYFMPNPGIMEKRSLLITGDADDANFYACETWQLTIRFNYPQKKAQALDTMNREPRVLWIQFSLIRRWVVVKFQSLPLRINELNGTKEFLGSDVLFLLFFKGCVFSRMRSGPGPFLISALVVGM
jgi:hypothetical protein